MYKKNDKYDSKKNLITTSEIKDIKEIKENKENKENKNNNFNMGNNYITIRTRDNQDNMSIIEVQLPNPYLNIDKPERNKTIEYRLKSKFRSPFADYINHSLTNDASNHHKGLNASKFINSNKVNNNIHFTRTQDCIKRDKNK